MKIREGSGKRLRKQKPITWVPGVPVFGPFLVYVSSLRGRFLRRYGATYPEVQELFAGTGPDSCKWYRALPKVSGNKKALTSFDCMLLDGYINFQEESLGDVFEGLP